MKLIEFKCKNCGAILKVDPNSDEIKCEHCLSLFKLDDEIKHLKVDDAEKIGYEFEKGRIRAQEENNANVSNNYSQLQKKKNNTGWLVLAWIFLLPFTATYFIAKSKSLNKAQKIVIIIVMWVVFLILGLIGEKEESELKEKMITKCYSQEAYDKLDILIGMSNIRLNVLEESECDGLVIKNSDYKIVNINMDKNKKLLSIVVDDKYIYGANTPDSTDNNLSNNASENEKTSNQTKKADYEFDTVDGYTTLQSLLLNIKKGDKYNKIKSMADYRGYYVKKMYGAEDNGGKEPIVNYEDLISKARQQEKQKQYKKIEKLTGEKNALTEQHNNDLLRIAELEKKLEEATKKLTSASGDDSEAVTTLKKEVETLKKEKKEVEDAFDKYKKENVPVNREEIENEIRESLEEEYKVKTHKAEVLAEHKDELLVPELVVGSTIEEIDSSLETALKRSAEIAEKVGGSIKKETKKKPKSGNASRISTEELTVDAIASLDPASPEYAEFRKKMGLK